MLRAPTWPVFALTLYVLAVGELVGIVEALSAGRWVTGTNVLALEGGLCVPVVAALRRYGYAFPPRPRPTLPPLLQVLAFVVGVALVYELAVGVLTPPNNWDSLAYHLSRAAAWFHQHRVGYVSSHTDRESNSAPNAEILILCQFLFVHSDRFATAWQWIAQLASVAAVYIIASRLNVSRAAAVFAALLFATLAQPALQATSTQNDLIAGSLVGAAVAFLCTDARGAYPLAAISLGLALGTKLTVAYVIAPLLLIATRLVPRSDWRRLLGWCIIAFAVLGAYIYALNIAHTGAIQGAGPSIAAWTQHSWTGRVKTGLLMAISLVVQILPTNWDAAYFGPLGAIAVVPVVVLTLKRAVRAKALTLETSLALAIPLTILGIAFTYRFNIWLGRFLLLAMVLTAPLFALLYKYQRYATVITGVGLASLLLSATQNVDKPAGLLGGVSIWTMSRPQAEAIDRPRALPYLLGIQRIPAHATVGYAIGPDDWDYPLYGADLSRTIVRLPPGAELPTAHAEHIRWVIARASYIRHESSSNWHVARLGDSGLELLTPTHRQTA